MVTDESSLQDSDAELQHQNAATYIELATVECYHVSVSVLALVNTFNSSTWYLKYWNQCSHKCNTYCSTGISKVDKIEIFRSSRHYNDQ